MKKTYFYNATYVFRGVLKYAWGTNDFTQDEVIDFMKNFPTHHSKTLECDPKEITNVCFVSCNPL